MLKMVATGLTTLLIAGSSLAYAQEAGAPAQQGLQNLPRLTAADRKALTDARIGIVKAALQLKPDQEKYWPAVEDAIRARAQMREQRSAALQARMEKGGEIQPTELLRARANALTERADTLKKLADAWQPLYASLDEDQKRRMRFLVSHVLHEAREGVESRRMQEEEETEED
jgi:zinc resistance-associated protein